MHVPGLIRVFVVPLLQMGIVAGLAASAGAQAPAGKTPVRPQKSVAPPPKFVPPQKTFVPPQKAATGQPKPLPMPAKGKGPKLPDPEDISLETKDGVSLKATFYPGTAKKEAVPIIMVHGFDGQRGDYHALAVELQRAGHASIAPDLRGHGQSKVQKRLDGTTVTLEAEKLTRPSLEDMVYDVLACKKFLMERNNAGELNIEQLCIIGADLGAILAARFAAYDWSLQDLPAYKQGKDVKALVLLSPPASFKGVTLRDALAFPPVQERLSIMFAAGLKDTKATTEAKKLYNSLQAHHPRLPDDEAERQKLQELFLIQPDVSLSGTKLLSGGTGLPQRIARFIEQRLVSRKADFAWQDRKNPLGN
jgi:pimeloyl-ACP methyl ester carboxylesterase